MHLPFQAAVLPYMCACVYMFIHLPLRAAVLPCRYCSPACQHSDWKAHKAQCVRQATATPDNPLDRAQSQPTADVSGSRSSTGASGVRVDPQLSARLLRDLKKAGLVPITPDNEEGWFLEIQGSTAEDGKVGVEGSGTLGHGSRTAL